jgi:hypothetical protein
MKKNQNNYFNQSHEDAIVRYAISTDQRERTELYIKFIEPAFNEMVDKIVFTYKFTTLPNIEELRDECKIWLTTILDKFNPTSGSKAFSYFSVITKNWFIHKVKKTAEQVKREVGLEDITDAKSHDVLIIQHEYFTNREQQEFWREFWYEINSWEHVEMKPNERRVVEAIKILMQDPDGIEIFNKKAIYLYIREITGLNTKQIVTNLQKVRMRYLEFKGDWNNGDI